jgi:ribosomal protein S18 acetylase RimI-like enzyme
MYKLEKATIENINKLKDYKLATVMEYATNIDELEKQKILNYVNTETPKNLEDYKLIKVDSTIVGCLLVINYKDGVLLDEIYLEENYRGLGIGSAIIKSIVKNHNVVYLWVYKENIKAIKLYEKLGFKIIEETETRSFMKYINILNG